MYSLNFQFTIGFWHVFGANAGESPEEIITRKQKEIRDNGWTLWSFQHRTRETLEAWYQQLRPMKPGQVLVFCSQSKDARDPSGKKILFKYFLPPNSTKPLRIPSGITVTLPIGKKKKIATAFIVKRIVEPIDSIRMPVEWLYKKSLWRKKRIPTRGEYLIKPGHGKSIRPYRAILELKAPYIAEISTDLGALDRPG